MSLATSAVLLFTVSTETLAAGNNSLLRISAARSAANTGVLDALAQRFELAHPGIHVEISSVGALTALNHARIGKADLVITHHPPAEDHFVDEGFGLLDIQFMHGNYAVFGPPEMASRYATQKDIVGVLKLLAKEQVQFLVPAPPSGTYRKIEALWALAGIEPKWFGYENSDSSSIATLIRASQEDAFAIADLSVYHKRRARLSKHIAPIFQGSAVLRNPYSALTLNPARVSHVNHKAASGFIEFLVSEEAQDVINNYGIAAYGTPMFNASAHLDTGLRARRAEQDAARQLNRFLVILVMLVVVALSLVAALLMTRRTLLAIKREQKSNRLSRAHQIDRDKALAASEIKSAFLSRMSHEFRTPLNAIIGYSELLQEEAQAKEDRESFRDLNNITVAGKHLLRLVNDILDLSKIEAGKESLLIEEIDINHFFQEIELLTTPLANANGNILAFTVGDGLGLFYNDSLKLRQILFNLIANACKFTTHGEIVTSARRHSERDGDWLVLSVADNGIGIPQDLLPKIFEEFAQAENTTARDYGGTGLGLTISKKLVALLGGHIEVESLEKSGTTFNVFLPLALEKSVPVLAANSRN